IKKKLVRVPQLLLSAEEWRRFPNATASPAAPPELDASSQSAHPPASFLHRCRNEACSSRNRQHPRERGGNGARRGEVPVLHPECKEIRIRGACAPAAPCFCPAG